MSFVKKWLKRKTGLKLLFVTSSLGTKWLDYSQNLIAREFPSSKLVIVNGSKNWKPLGFIEDLEEYRSFDFLIHIDEDCFLFDGNQLKKILYEMMCDSRLFLAGSPDGGMPYRHHNPYACNLFFVIFRPDIVFDLIKNNPDWMSMKWNPKYQSSFGDFKFWTEHKTLDDFESSYYPLFWLGLDKGYRIKYLSGTFNSRYKSTDLYTSDDKQPFARHMWYARSCNSPANFDRYNLHEEEVLKGPQDCS